MQAALQDWETPKVVSRNKEAPHVYNAYPYSALDLGRARHVHELKPRENLTLNLGLAQSGLGSESCGPGVLPQYRLEARDYRYSLRLRPRSGPEDSPQVLSRQVLSRLSE